MKALKNRSVNVHSMAMVPRPDVPRSSFRMQSRFMATMDAGYLNPIFLQEVLPGDTFRVSMNGFARMATPIFPVMDNLHFESFFFFVPLRLVWANFKKFMGEQNSPGDSISYTIPQIVSKASGYDIGSIFDLLGLPTVGQVGGGNTVSHSALPLRCYAKIYDDWFRDENLCVPYAASTGDGPDLYTAYSLAKRGKRHDYFTSALPWPQKGTAVSMPLGTTAPVIPTGDKKPLFKAADAGVDHKLQIQSASTTAIWTNTLPGVTSDVTWSDSKLVADLSTATAATINQLRQSFQIQKLLERDARGGTRYTEIVTAHFGVKSPDARLQRPEYLGGGRDEVQFTSVAQTTATGLTGGTTPIGTLAAAGTLQFNRHGFSQSFTEHGYIVGIGCVFADLTYQQGLERHWSRLTRYDFYFPAFAHLGEQALLNKEIYCDGSANDDAVFGYLPRWEEYRYKPSKIVGLFRSTAAGTLDAWHLAQKFTALPTLNSTFIQETPPVDRVLAVTSAGKQFLFDCFFDVVAARPLPMYSVPGQIDRF